MIHLGYEVKTGTAVAIPLRHTAVIGLTQESGKTTTLEALITRANLRALAFVTKRGEGSFNIGRIIPPYFQEPAQDASQPLWQYVASLLETTLGGEKLRMQRASIMRVCDAGAAGKNASWEKPVTLAQVAANIEIALAHTRSGFDQSMYLQLREYFRIVTPQIENLPRASALEIKPGLNIMYLEGQPAQMQALIITSCFNWIRTREKNTVTIIPEGWKFLGEGRASPAVAAGEQLIREGGVLQNFLWLDSQDLVGIAPQIRKSIGVWILGRQGEINEAERTVKHLPTDRQKPKPSDIQRLGKGYFYVSAGKELRKVYVQPSWMEAGTAQLVAATESPAPPRPKSDKGDDEMWRERAEELEQELRELRQYLENFKDEVTLATGRYLDQIHTQKETIAELQKVLERKANPVPPPNPTSVKKILDDPDCLAPAIVPSSASERATEFLTNVWPLVREAVAQDPVALRLFVAAPELEVITTPKIIKIDGESLRGSLALMIHQGFFNKDVTAKDVTIYLKNIGRGTANSNLSRELKAFTKMGFLVMNGNTKGTSYKRAPRLKITTRSIETE
jgi:hypothetical protein